MKAEVQYNDYVGTSAADISDFKKLGDWLKEWGVDTVHYEPIGVSFYTGESGNLSFYILCKDKTRSVNECVKISNPNIKLEDLKFFFKRFEVILTKEEFIECNLEDEPVITIGEDNL